MFRWHFINNRKYSKLRLPQDVYSKILSKYFLSNENLKCSQLEALNVEEFFNFNTPKSEKKMKNSESFNIGSIVTFISKIFGIDNFKIKVILI